MKELRQNLLGVHREYEDQSKVSQSLMEEQQQKMKEQFEQEKQILEEKKKQELAEKINMFTSTIE